MLNVEVAPVPGGNPTLYVIGAAIGISLARFGTASAKMLFENADRAMYQAKARRDGSYQFCASVEESLP